MTLAFAATLALSTATAAGPAAASTTSVETKTFTNSSRGLIGCVWTDWIVREERGDYWCVAATANGRNLDIVVQDLAYDAGAGGAPRFYRATVGADALTTATSSDGGATGRLIANVAGFGDIDLKLFNFPDADADPRVARTHRSDTALGNCFMNFDLYSTEPSITGGFVSGYLNGVPVSNDWHERYSYVPSPGYSYECVALYVGPTSGSWTMSSAEVTT